MGVYLYAVAATGKRKVDMGPAGKVTVFPMVYRWKYWPWTYNNDAPPIRQSFNLARIERNAQRAIANKEYQGFVALYGIEKGCPVYYLREGECLWNDSGEVPGTRVGWIDERIADGSLFLSEVDPNEHVVY